MLTGEIDVGASETHPQQCSALRKNGYVMIKGRPCKIVEMLTSKTGEHGHTMIHLVALDIFTNKKFEEFCPSTQNMDIPNVVRKDYQLVNIDDGFLELMDNSGEPKDDIRVPDDDIGKTIEQKFNDGEQFGVTILTAVGEEKAVGTKVLQDV